MRRVLRYASEAAPRLSSPARAGIVRAAALGSQRLAFRVAVTGGVSLATLAVVEQSNLDSAEVDWAQVRQAIEDLLEDDTHDDGSYGPIFVRLAWHASGTFDKSSCTGGSVTGASMRFSPECDWGANAGLGKARARLESVKAQFPGASYADIWTLAGVVAVESMGGPTIPWTAGRVDCTEETRPELPDGLLPDATQGAQHLRDVFGRMGFNDREIVALSGAHTLGRCHPTSSGFVNPWTNAPTTFSNLFFQELVDKRWEEKEWNGPKQYEDSTGKLMMLPTDLVLMDDPSFKKYTVMYSKDEDLFFKDFSAAFGKLLALGQPSKPWYQFW